MSIFSKIKEKIISGISSEDTKEYPTTEVDDDYLEIDLEKDTGKKSKVVVRPFVIEDFADIKPTLDALREGYTIALVNIKPLKEKDIIELKRAVNKIKKTCDAIEGDIAGFGDDWIVVTPNFASIHRTTQTEDVNTEE